MQSWLATWVAGVNFKRPGQDQSLGRDIALKEVELIADRGQADHRGPDGEWAENSSRPSKQYPQGYKQFKEEHYDVYNSPNVRTGQMLSATSLYGKTEISETEILLKYGTDRPPDSSGGDLTDEDKAITDTEKAILAHTGQGKSGITRPFYAAIESDGVPIAALAQENINEYIRETNRDNGY
jgi:hypothetical protein